MYQASSLNGTDSQLDSTIAWPPPSNRPYSRCAFPKKAYSSKSRRQNNLYSWLILFTWAFGGVALAILLHKTFFVLGGGFAVLARHLAGNCNNPLAGV
jgi:hypothetical protein